jgi:hypothetical protein
LLTKAVAAAQKRATMIAEKVRAMVKTWNSFGCLFTEQKKEMILLQQQKGIK